MPGNKSSNETTSLLSEKVWRNARLATLDPSLTGLGIIENGAIAVRNGRIVFVGAEAALPADLADINKTIDCQGRWITPALIDCHTHLVFGGNRAMEFEMRLNGATYEEIAKAGGGIVSSVRDTRTLSEEALVAQALPRLDTLLSEGVSTIEIKSGYGLNIETELKMLRVARKLQTLRPIRILTSYLAAHATPTEYKGRNADYINDVVLPGLEQAHAEGLVDAVDGFCEGIAFSVEDMRRVFDKAKQLGLPVKLHAEQLSNLGGSELAASFGALSADHLEYLDEKGANALAEAGTVAVLLPGAFYALREKQAPPVQALRDAVCDIALATDCNPGTSPLTSLLLTMNMGATLFRLTVEECLTATTRTAAKALGLTSETGTLEVGKSADLAIWDIERPSELVYRIGFNPLHSRIFKGETVSPMTITLHPGAVPLTDLANIYWNNGAARLDRSFDAGIEKAARRIAEIAAGNAPVYGINTGFGKLASIKIDAADVATLQRNLILSHCCGVGAPLPENVVRLIMALKLISLGRGASGVRLELVRLIEGMLDKGVIPAIPEKGSVGASGDLAPLAHMAAVMMGEGEAFYQGALLPAAEALAKAALQPVVLAAKEGLALINGTQTSTALALAGLFRAHRAAQAALITGALSTDAAMGSSAPFHPDIHTLRGHKGQIDAGAALRQLLEGSEIRVSHIEGDERVQDPYCIRCQPQVDGACLDLLRQVARTLEIEANAVTDNPLVLSDNSVVSGGNFHAEPVAFAADQIALAICEIGAIAQRRIALLVDPSLSYGLPAFLSKKPGLNSGLMIAEVTSAALMSENKQMSHPASVDSTPTSANQEDHVSMACHGARRLLAMTENLFAILGIEALSAVQGVELRGPLKTSPELQKAIDVLRAEIPSLEDDRFMAPELKTAAELIATGALVSAISTNILPKLEV